MLSEDRKRAIERSAMLEVRHSWGGLMATRIRGVIDDIRAKVVEEPWFGRQVTGSLNDFSQQQHPADVYGVADFYRWMSDTARDAHADVYGPAQEALEFERPDRDRQRDGPEAGG